MESSGKQEVEEKMEGTGPASGSIPGKEVISAESPSPDHGNREFILFRKVQGAMRHIPDFSET